MTLHLLEFTLFVAILAGIAVALIGWGRLACAWIGLSQGDDPWCLPFWLGLGSAIVFAEISHLVVPIDWKISIAYSTVGLLLFARSAWPTRWRWPWPTEYSWVARLPLYIALALVMAMWASKAMDPSLHYDVGLYYIPTIKWLNEEPVIPGLVNLHGRLAFNQSVFSFAALLNFYPYWNHGLAGANLLLFVATVASIFRLLGDGRASGRAFRWILLPVFIGVLYRPPNPSPDFSNAMLQVLEFAALFSIWHGARANVPPRTAPIILLIVVSLLSMTIKLSNVAFAVSCLVLGLYWSRQTLRDQSTQYVRLGALAAILFGTHCLTGYLLSGYPFFPSTFGRASALPWTASVTALHNEVDWITSWARAPGKLPDDVLGNWDWLAPWTIAFPPATLLTLQISGVCIAVAMAAGLARKRRPDDHGRAALILYLPLALGGTFWFLTAPDVRFLGVLPELALALSVWLLWSSIRPGSVVDAHRTSLWWAGRTILAFVAVFYCALYFGNIVLGVRLTEFSGLTHLIPTLSPQDIQQRIVAILMLGMLIAATTLPNPNRLTGRMLVLSASTFGLCLTVSLMSELMFFNIRDLHGWRAVADKPFSKVTSKSGLQIFVPQAGSDQCWDIPLPCTAYPSLGLRLVSVEVLGGVWLRKYFSLEP